MKRKDFSSLIQSANNIVAPRSPKNSLNNLNESVNYNTLTEGFSQEHIQLAEAVTGIIEEAEKRLNIKMNEQEIKEATDLIIESAAKSILVEHVQNDVGFILTEDEQKYVLEQIMG